MFKIRSFLMSSLQNWIFSFFFDFFGTNFGFYVDSHCAFFDSFVRVLSSIIDLFWKCSIPRSTTLRLLLNKSNLIQSRSKQKKIVFFLSPVTLCFIQNKINCITLRLKVLVLLSSLLITLHLVKCIAVD